MPSRVQAVRGCLYKLEVTNFKSYAGNLQIGPFKDFTCVIGPNGSGSPPLSVHDLLCLQLHVDSNLSTET